MSRVTSLRARSNFSWDSARTDFLTMSCAWSEFVPTTSMEPQTLSISRDLCWTPAIENDFWMFSSSCTGMSRLDSSRVIGDTDGEWRFKGRGAATFITGCGTFMATDWPDKEKGSRQLAINTAKKRVSRMV